MVPFYTSYEINGVLGGWEEGFYSDSASPEEARAAARALIAARRGLLAQGTNIISCSITRAGMPPETFNLRGFPLSGGTFSGASAASQRVNNIKDSIHYKVVNANNTACQRHLRGVPDPWVRAEGLDQLGFDSAEYQFGVDVPDMGDIIGDGLPPLAYLRMFAHLLFTHYGSVRVQDRAPKKKGQKLGRPIDWTFSEYKRFEVIRPSTKNVGRPRGPFRGRRRKTCSV